MACHAYRGRRTVRCLCRHGLMMTAYDCAAEAWLDQAEAATSMYPTELAQFKAEHPRPQLAEFMKGSY